GRRAMDRYVGELFGLMSRRVLGQYDPVIAPGAAATDALPSPALYMVEPNLVLVQRKEHAPMDSLRRWLILHELTHAWQFGEHPWLRDHIMSMLKEMIDSGLTVEGMSLLRSRDLVRRLPDTVRAQMRVVSQVQAVMSVLEGYSNFVMHRVGRRHVEHADQLEEALHHRRQQRTLLERLVFALTGLEMKMRQYEVGERFCDAVVERSDLATLNRVWEVAAAMPTMDELKNPERWLARMR
ncbi:MAG TPA: zinc-dependent metalloprotease, partial [Candidatus Dormibacteraeota bacterium]